MQWGRGVDLRALGVQAILGGHVLVARMGPMCRRAGSCRCFGGAYCRGDVGERIECLERLREACPCGVTWELITNCVVIRHAAEQHCEGLFIVQVRYSLFDGHEIIHKLIDVA